MLSNKLKLNGDKTHIMLLASGHAWRSKVDEDSICLNTGQETIKTSSSEVLLGGLINSDLKWSQYILLGDDSLVKKLGKRLAALKIVSRVADFRTRKLIANGLFMSKLIYLMPVWGGCEGYLVKALQIQQNKAARHVTARGKYTPIKDLLHECGWLSVNQLIFFHTVLLLHKIINAGAPRTLFRMFSSDYVYNTRNKTAGKLKVQADNHPHLNLNSKSFRWRSVTCWNMLPSSLTKITGRDSFKVQFKAWIWKNIPIDA